MSLAGNTARLSLTGGVPAASASSPSWAAAAIAAEDREGRETEKRGGGGRGKEREREGGEREMERREEEPLESCWPRNKRTHLHTTRGRSAGCLPACCRAAGPAGMLSDFRHTAWPPGCLPAWLPGCLPGCIICLDAWLPALMPRLPYPPPPPALLCLPGWLAYLFGRGRQPHSFCLDRGLKCLLPPQMRGLCNGPQTHNSSLEKAGLPVQGWDATD